MVDTARHPAATRSHAFVLTRFSRELIAMGALFFCYWFGRSLHTVDVSAAYDNAQLVWEIERFVRMPNELSAQNAMLAVDGMTEFANTYYALVHFPATTAFLIWMYLRRPQLYPPVRRAIIAMTSIALLVHLAFPLAPPRMLGELGFIDTGALYGPISVYGSSPEEADLINHYAAMPSLHVGWAMLVAAGLIAAFRTRWRWLWLLHPTVTAVAVVTTANHYWLDGIVACILLAAVTLAIGRIPPARWARLVPPRLRRIRVPAGRGPEATA